MDSLLHDDDVQFGHTTDTTRVPAQKIQNYRSNRWIALKCFSIVSVGCFTWSCVESVVHADDVWLGHTTDITRVLIQKVYNYRSDCWIALKFFSGVSVAFFTWSSVYLILHVDEVRSGHTTNTTRVPAQKVHNYRSDRWIALNFFSRVSKCCFTWSSMESIRHADDVRSDPTIDKTRLSVEKVRNYTSDRWIALNIFSRVSRGCFTWSSVEFERHADDVRSGLTTHMTRVPAQKVHNYRSDHWIVLKCFSQVSRGCFWWSCVESV